MTETVHGNIKFPETIDITDPSYDEDVWCRINNLPIEAGEYECYTVTADNDETDGWGDRIARIGIRKQGAQIKHTERIGLIGVDSGLAGFFNCDNQLAYEEALDNSVKDVFLSDKAFFSSSGYGDGGYDIYAGYSGGKPVEVYIEFIENGDEDV